MRPVSPTFLERITGPHRSTARAVVLDPVTFAVRAVLSAAGEDYLGPSGAPGGMQPGEGVTLSGSVTMDRKRSIRRTCDVTFVNPDGELTPDLVGDLLSVNSLLRLERGVYLDEDTVEWCVLGHFLIGRPRVEVTPEGSTVAVTGEDRAKLLVRSRFIRPTSYAVGSRMAVVIATEAATAGMGTTHYRMNDEGYLLNRERVFEEDESRAKALTDLAQDAGYELFVDADGYLVLDVPPDPMTAPTVWRYEAGESAIMLGLTKEWTDDRLYNHVLVTGEWWGGAPIRSEARDLNPASPAYIYGPLGDRLYRYTSPSITTSDRASRVARNLLAEVALVEESISVPSVTNPALEPGDAIVVTEPLSGTDGRYLIDSVQVPLGPGAQTIGARVARSLT